MFVLKFQVFSLCTVAFVANTVDPQRYSLIIQHDQSDGQSINNDLLLLERNQTGYISFFYFPKPPFNGLLWIRVLIESFK